MNKQTYLADHLPHRINLLITFRDRFRAGSLWEMNSEDARDFFRCSKDIAMLMVRFFLGEIGVCLRKNDSVLSKRRLDRLLVEFGIRRLLVDEVRDDRRHDSILQIMKSANRAVAHLDSNYALEAIHTDQMLYDAIDFTEEMVRAKIYHSDSGYNLDEVMALPNNTMHRRLLLPQAGKA